jgi:predicted ATPase
VVAVAVDARGWNEAGQALEQLEGCEGKRLATVQIGLGEPVDQAGLRRGERPDAGRGVKPLQGERPPGAVANEPLETRPVLALDADGAVDGEATGPAPRAHVRRGARVQEPAPCEPAQDAELHRAGQGFRIPGLEAGGLVEPDTTLDVAGDHADLSEAPGPLQASGRVPEVEPKGRSMPKRPPAEYGSPFLTHVLLREDRVMPGHHPFSLPLFSGGLSLDITSPVTLLVGENGSGKSTLLEALAWSAGFSSQGGNRTNEYAETDDGAALGRALKLAWSQKATSGFFLRAETLFNFATYLENAGSNFKRYGGTSLHHQSHGEAFLSLFSHRFAEGLYLLDEPEAALSPQRQLAFLSILHDLTSRRVAQFVIATHSPILLAFPGATVLSMDGLRIHEVDYRETEHFRVTRDFLASPERFFRHLFGDSD